MVHQGRTGIDHEMKYTFAVSPLTPALSPEYRGEGVMLWPPYWAAVTLSAIAGTTRVTVSLSVFMVPLRMMFCRSPTGGCWETLIVMVDRSTGCPR